MFVIGYSVCFLVAWGWIAYKRKDLVRLKQTFFLFLYFLLFPQLMRLLLLVCYPAQFSSLTGPLILQGMWKGVPYDLSMMILWGGMSLFLLNLPIRSVIYRCIAIAFSILVGLVYGVVLVADVVYFKYVFRHVGADIFNFFLSVPIILRIAFKTYWPICLGIAVVGGGLMYLIQRQVSQRPQRGPWIYEGMFLLCLVFFCWFGERGFFFDFDPLAPHQAYQNGQAQGNITLNGVFGMSYILMPSHYIKTAKKSRVHPTFNELGEEQSRQLAQDLLLSPDDEKVLNAVFPFERVRTKFNADARGRNLIILAIESLDYTAIDAIAGTSHGATPNLDALVRQGMIFDRFFSCGEASSLIGIGTTMSGICHVAGFPYFSRGLEQVNQHGLGDLFKQAGYETVFVRACSDAMMYIGPISRLMGFDSFDKAQMQSNFPNISIHDAQALETLAEQFKTRKKPFAGFFFSTATHEPLGDWGPKHWNKQLEEKFQNEPYFRMLAYTDEAIGRFLDFLKQNGLYDNTVFVVLGDHPQRTNSVKGAEKFHVPLSIVAPGILKPGRYNTIAGQADILPTLVDLFHLSVPYAAMGRSLLEKTDKDWTFVHTAEDDFAFVTSEGLFFSNKASTFHNQMVGLNKAVCRSLQQNKWSQP